jgi:methyl-accepting chemotaxis protein
MTPARIPENESERLAALHTLLVGFVVALGLLAGGTWLEWRQSAKTLETADFVAQTHYVEAELNRLVGLVQDIETGERGYVLTGEPAFLEPFEAGVKSVSEQQRMLMQLIRDWCSHTAFVIELASRRGACTSWGRHPAKPPGWPPLSSRT